jgi:hypothetical protein
MAIEVDIWVRGTQDAITHEIEGVGEDPQRWTDVDVGRLLSEMLLALERSKNPGGDAPAITLRGFSWIVSAYESGGVIVHLEMQMGTASAGPFAIGESHLTTMIQRVMSTPGTGERVH